MKDGEVWAYQTTVTNPGDNDGFTNVNKLNRDVTDSRLGALTSSDYYEPIKYNLVKLALLTSNPVHTELTVDKPDAVDVTNAEEGYCGALTAIKMKGTKDFAQWTFANIEEGYYYIQNAKT
ncbi:MAG: hypothetical protein LUD46_22335 [Parabacteroides sp.]|nr:hypothetical protein [Parabacteroides sp.]